MNTFNDRQRLDLSVLVFRRLSSPRYDNGSVTGRLERTEENCRLVGQLIDEGLASPTDEFRSASLGSSAELELIPPRRQDCFFAQSVGEILASGERCSRSPAMFYVADCDSYVCSAELEVDQDIQKYLQATRAVDLLRSVVDVEDHSRGWARLIFLQKEKLEIDIRYGIEDLRELAGLSDFERMVGEETHKEQRKAILKKTLLTALRDVPLQDRFPRFLEEFDSIFSSFKYNYELYVSEFTFDKLMSEMQQRKVDYLVRMGKTFSEIQNQLLGIPVSVVLVGSSMKPAGNLTMANTMVMLGILVFSILMQFLIRNQRDSLVAIKGEIDLHGRQLEGKDRAKANEWFGGIYKELESRYRRQRRLLSAVSWLVVVLFVFTVAVFLRHTLSGEEFDLIDNALRHLVGIG